MQLDAFVSAIVTGAAGPVGSQVARRLAAAGAKVALFDIDEVRGRALAGEIGGLFCKVDVTSVASLETGLEISRRMHGPERILVNAAKAQTSAVAGEAWHDAALRGYDRAVEVELVGAVRCIEATLPHMQDLAPLEDGERAVVVNAAWLHGRHAVAGRGFLAMVTQMASELAGTGVRINTVTSGFGASPANRQVEFAKLVLTMIAHSTMTGAIVRVDQTPGALN